MAFSKKYKEFLRNCINIAPMVVLFTTPALAAEKIVLRRVPHTPANNAQISPQSNAAQDEAIAVQPISRPVSSAPVVLKPPVSMKVEKEDEDEAPVSSSEIAVDKVGVAQCEGALSIAQAMRLAYLNNPSLNSGRADLLATQEELPQAQAGWKPIVTADADVTNTDSDSGASNDNNTSKGIGLTLTQPIYRGGRTTAQSSSARNLIAARSDLLRAQEQDVFLSAVTAYVDVLRDRALVELQQQNQELQGKQLKATRDRFEVGELTKTDVSQSDARLAEAESNVIDARGNLSSSRAVFEQVVGVPADDLVPPNLTLEIPGSLEDAILQAEENSPLVKASINSHRSSEDDVDSTFGELLPEVGFFAGIDRTYDPPSGLSDDRTDRNIGIEASVPLYEAGAVRSRVRQAKYIANSRYLDILEAKREARESTVRSWEDLQAARAVIRSRQAQVIASRIAQEGVKQEAEFGARSILDSLDADQELLDAEVALVVARRDEVVAQFSLLASLGVLTPEALGFGTETINLDERLDDTERKIFDMGVDRVGQPG